MRGEGRDRCPRNASLVFKECSRIEDVKLTTREEVKLSTASKRETEVMFWIIKVSMRKYTTRLEFKLELKLELELKNELELENEVELKFELELEVWFGYKRGEGGDKKREISALEKSLGFAETKVALILLLEFNPTPFAIESSES